MAKKKETEGGAATADAPAAAPAAPKQPSQNGVTRPKSGTATGRVWEIADELSKATGQPASRGDVIKAFTAEGGNQATGATQYGRWCKFFGISKPRSTTAPAASAVAGNGGAEVEE